MNPVGLGNKNRYAGEDQQQFSLDNLGCIEIAVSSVRKERSGTGPSQASRVNGGDPHVHFGKNSVLKNGLS
jgi:hypothetical protein